MSGTWRICQRTLKAFSLTEERTDTISVLLLCMVTKDPDVKGHLIIDEEAAEVVREVLHCFHRDMERPPLPVC